MQITKEYCLFTPYDCMSRSHLFIILFLFTFFTEACFAAQSEVSSEDAYQKAKFYYNQLETNKSLAENRDLWLKATRNFRKVYLADPKSSLASPSLFMQGKIYLRMYEKFGKKRDLTEANTYFRNCHMLFPQHKLADDALYALGETHEDLLSKHEQAARYFSQILEKYPNGDMHPQASSRLKALSSEFDTPLPSSMLGDSNHKKLSNVLPVKYWSSEDYCRVIIKASGPVTYEAQHIEKKNKTGKLHIDFKGSYIEPRFRTPIPVAEGLLKRILTDQQSQETVRVTLDIGEISNFKIFSLPDPFRVVVDVRGKVEEIPPEAAKTQIQISKPNIQKSQVIVLKDEKKSKPYATSDPHEEVAESEVAETEEMSAEIKDVPELSLAQQLGLGVKKIVLDPGHGGKDPGAMANGLKEKDIVLKLAYKLEEKIKNSLDCEVVLTRKDDTYLPLVERTAIANANNADLFISLHINAHPVSSVGGLETYYLNLSSNKEAMRVAAFENATSELQLSDLQDVLADIMQNSKIEESSRFARSVHNSMVKGLEQQEYQLKDLGVKQAPFYVLIGAEMPSILVESAFITNPGEAEILKEEKFIDSLAQTILKGIRHYIESNTAFLPRDSIQSTQL